MGWHYTNLDVPFIRDHAAALKLYESITPLKHGPNKGKPIGVPEYARRLLAMERDGRLNPPG